MSSSGLNIVRATAERQVAALRILLSTFPEEEQAARLQDSLLSVQRGTLNLDGIWLAECHGQPVGAALIVAQDDGVGLVWPPVAVDPAHADAVRSELMAVLTEQLELPGIKFGQVLLSPEEASQAGWLQDYGFACTAELYFLARALELPPSDVTAPPGLVREVYDESRNADRFAAVIEQTYLESLDCPALNGARTGRDALAGHRLSGEFHPRGWSLYRYQDRDAAILLLNEHPDQDAVELVYFGVSREFRGQNLGRCLLRDALLTAQSWDRAVMFLAVDAGNTFANQLYAEAGFQEVARRSVWLRFPRSLAHK